MLLTGRRVSADEALRFGLIGHIVEDGKALESKRNCMTVSENALSLSPQKQSLREFDGSLHESEALAKELELATCC